MTNTRPTHLVALASLASQVLAFINTVEMAAQMILRGFDAGGGQIRLSVLQRDRQHLSLIIGEEGLIIVVENQAPSGL